MPFAIYQANDDTHPTNSITTTVTKRFLADVRPTATSTTGGSKSLTATGSIRSLSTYTTTTDNSSKNDSNHDSAWGILSVVQTVGIVIGSLGAIIISVIVYARPKGLLKTTDPNSPYGPSQQMGVPVPIITPSKKKQSVKKPVIAIINNDSTVVSSVVSLRKQENATTIEMNNNISYTHEMTNQSSPPTAITYQQAYLYYSNEMHYRNQQMPYPSQDTMPVPTHFSTPASPTSPPFAYIQQQPMYPPQIPKPDSNKLDNKTQQVPMTATANTVATKIQLAAASKTEQVDVPHQVEYQDTEFIAETNDNTAPTIQKPSRHSSQ